MILPILGLAGLAGGGALAAGATGATALQIAGIGASIGGQIHGGGKAAEAARTEAELKNQAAYRQYGYDMQLWDLNKQKILADRNHCLLYTSPSPRDGLLSRMPSSA